MTDEELKALAERLDALVRERQAATEAQSKAEAQNKADQNKPDEDKKPDDQGISPKPPDITTVTTHKLEWEGLIPHDSKAYRRGSSHDGTQRQIDAMTTRSKGSPFDAANDDDDEW